MHSPLGRLVPQTFADPSQIERMARAAWQQHRGLWIPDGYGRNEIEREYFEALGTELYGRRG